MFPLLTVPVPISIFIVSLDKNYALAKCHLLFFFPSVFYNLYLVSSPPEILLVFISFSVPPDKLRSEKCGVTCKDKLEICRTRSDYLLNSPYIAHS